MRTRRTGTEGVLNFSVKEYVRSNGYANVPGGIWRKLNKNQQEQVKQFNGGIKRKRFREKDKDEDGKEVKRIRRAMMGILEGMDMTSKEKDQDPNVEGERGTKDNEARVAFRIKRD